MSIAAALGKFKTAALIALATFVAADVYAWSLVATPGAPGAPAEYFFDAGQGMSALVVLPGGAKVLIDAGPSVSLAAELGAVLRPGDRYIDLAVILGPEPDHFAGLADLMDAGYRFGAFLYDGRRVDAADAAWPDLSPQVTLGAGDVVSFGPSRIEVLSPDRDFAQSVETRDADLVLRVATPDAAVLFTGDAGLNVAHSLVGRPADLRADILVIGYGGPQFAPDDPFLRAVGPKAIVESGSHAGTATAAKIFRTDLTGTVVIGRERGGLRAKVLYNGKE